MGIEWVCKECGELFISAEDEPCCPYCDGEDVCESTYDEAWGSEYDAGLAEDDDYD